MGMGLFSRPDKLREATEHRASGVVQAVGPAAATAVLDRPPSPRSGKVAPKPVDPMREEHLKEYAELAMVVGVSPPDLVVEAFKDFLRAKDWGVYPLADVVAYMDAKAAAESKEAAGWHWRPLREKDHIPGAVFGVSARRDRSSGITPASDGYRGPESVNRREWGLHDGPSVIIIPPEQQVYDKTIPLHALRKVAAVEREFKTGPVAFFVCDYAPAPAIEYPDPFLMAAINNPKLNIGIGRFVIDFWDEPGFGLRQMLGV